MDGKVMPCLVSGKALVIYHKSEGHEFMIPVASYLL